jgi:hypothetical protein
MTKQIIRAANLGSGDVIKLPRRGWQQIERITAANSLSVSYRFMDGKTRSFRPETEVEAFLNDLAPLTGNERAIFRQSRKSGRIVVCLPHSLFDLWDFKEVFFSLRERVSCTREAALLIALERGATAYTTEAIYWMPFFQKTV